MTKATDQCFELLVTSVIISLAFLLSLTFNIVHCVMKHRREKEMKFSSQHSISYDQQYMETNPIYGNLNQSILDHTDECCYEPMATPHERKRQEIQVAPEEPMFYAALNLSPKKPGKTRKKKARPISNESYTEDKSASSNGNILSTSSIYLNSEQLTAECTAEEDLVHDDPIRCYHLLKKTRNNVAMEEENQV
ncbi:T-cell receptor-associated transmembrane adapter 1 isoform X1 [Mixophyes fleayi]|uniref:T-cell receptor-associated transmembrane adapter 1 isoform X1 n=1 Tax=Mixophyes fleayi TaxID=3061075 RepID=UPI003F4DE905